MQVKIKQTLYKWLPRIFGCHCRDDRSFHYKGKRFPICARCTGELAGMCLGALSFAFIKPRLILLIMLMLPMTADGFIQLTTPYESNNMRRLWTGILFGYSLVTLFNVSTVWAFEYGKAFGEKLLSI